DYSGEESLAQSQSQSGFLLKKAREEHSKGNLISAFNFSKEAYLLDPENELAVSYYVEMLEFLGRYVEASEIKHKNKKKITPTIISAPEEESPKEPDTNAHQTDKPHKAEPEPESHPNTSQQNDAG